MSQKHLFPDAAPEVRSSAVFSQCERYRYRLTRRWATGGQGMCAFICLNPSTADATQDDPTVRRCVNFSKDWGYDGFIMLNLFAFRATEPADMMAADDPVGPENDRWLLQTAKESSLVVAAWGADGVYRDRNRAVLGLLRAEGIALHYLELTKHREPRHPLYLKSDLKPKPL